MARTISIIAILALVSLAAASRNPCLEAFETCDFRFRSHSRSVPVFYLSGPADEVFTPRIFSLAPHEKLGILNTNGIAVEVIENDGSATPVTQFGKPPFTPTHIKPLRIGRSSGSGLGHESFSGNQLELATSGACVRIFFTSYQVLQGHRFVKKNLNDVMAREQNKCVVFIAN